VDIVWITAPLISCGLILDRQCFIFSLISLHFKIKPSKFTARHNEAVGYASWRLMPLFYLHHSSMILCTRAYKSTTITQTDSAICRSLPSAHPLSLSLMHVYNPGNYDIKEPFCLAYRRALNRIDRQVQGRVNGLR
jgi:hypothetical protein